MLKEINYSLSTYFKNLKLSFLFSTIPFLVAFLIPIFVKTPVYVALGGVYLRTGSIGGDVTLFDAAIMILSFIVSVFLISFATVNINLVIKSTRTSVLISREVLSGIGKYTLNVFWLFLTFELLVLICQLLLFTNPLSTIIYPIATILLVLPFFYCPSAIVVDELRPWRAIQRSFNFAISKFPLFLMWIAIGFVIIAATELVFFAFLPQDFAVYAVLAVAALFTMPFLLILQTQIYLSKYTIVP